ncbi:MAG: hypothetical protein V7L05_12665 [Nostoc sp.]|uniref:hypothetical protein n=1 Tax=Nostoc sp. TaxID=1180 RepID=UPI002FFB93BF
MGSHCVERVPRLKASGVETPCSRAAEARCAKASPIGRRLATALLTPVVQNSE